MNDDDGSEAGGQPRSAVRKRWPDLSGRPQSLELVRTLAAKPERVFGRFTGKGLEGWFAAPGSVSMRQEAGAPFFFETAFENERHAHYGRLLDFEAPRRLVMTWLTESGTKGAETVLTLELEPVAGGTRVTLRHEGFPDEESRTRHADAWPQVLSLLEDRLKA